MNTAPLDILKSALTVLDRKKADEIVAIEVTNVTIIADYFLICSANSSTQLKALYEELEFKLKEQGITPIHIEGSREGGWIVLDYGSVIVHIFEREQRDFYDLERLWADGVKMDISGLIEKKAE
ncbi:MAG: ribosome silencing factor [Clostridia bacterium]|jgi:ribosome-associated protein|nr:ribosome silencing factor [Clostridia bacterium]MBQ1375812.1 ribosome silencing factor [Clostridia bacterium]MBQ1434540.1 ribosome silencing factor [Clostridia bacterium]MBQ4249340.1 ribosome silencing factor [Clostridia bacterium]